MSDRRPHVSGDVLASRYELADLVSESLGASNWRAVDRILHRNVRVEMLSADDPRGDNFLQAARRSTSVTDHRFLRVLDLLQEEDGVHVVVREWAKATPLSRVLAQSPLPNRRAATVVAEVAESLAHAHDRGLVHRRLTPHQVLLKESGAVRIVGLGVATALAPVEHQDSADDMEAYRAADVNALGKLLYACLVSRWPGGHVDGLRAAPTVHGHLLRPRQVRAGVLRELDDICDRILEPGRHPHDALTTAEEIARVLYQAAEGEEDLFDEPLGYDVTSPDLLRMDPVVEPSGPPPGLEPPRRRPKAFAPKPPTRRERLATRMQSMTHGDRALILLGLVTAIVLSGVLAFLVGRESGRQGDPFSQSAPDAPVRVLPVERVVDFDPQGGDGAESPDQTGAAIDDDPATGWRTSTYFGRADLGGLKDGVGVILDLGAVRQVEQVRLRLAGTPTDLSILTAPATTTTLPRSLDELREVATLNGATEDLSVALPRDARTRFVVVWLRSLPQVAPGEFRGEIRSVIVRGR
ncbi:protein kinase family protein [Aeromicrobium duanguangcaii]|uniref:non-specific serine/threonine protein kinase n=1 Tax=Aeromicrobium duanguangcaii TaxID=2968086 RepID=A0ABY5KHA1_9ACTN|nr:protein kinase family protein [Aeromicrobium duanguangcaii]MCD9154410.1 protein kinase family protein [Aeromicrobium duanguangcaii]MCL3838157.1 protein kinase family protein [Aeromicrobium duanguangcaii]UUI68527.1 protein kinase family protein [Aeromicrobium duanguangcaii]